MRDTHPETGGDGGGARGSGRGKVWVTVSPRGWRRGGCGGVGVSGGVSQGGVVTGEVNYDSQVGFSRSETLDSVCIDGCGWGRRGAGGQLGGAWRGLCVAGMTGGDWVGIARGGMLGRVWGAWGR